MILKISSNLGDFVIRQLLAKFRDVDEVSSVLSPAGPVLRFPDGDHLHVLRATP